MGIAALILGIIAIITGWIPFVCFISLILAIVGLVLGIVDTIKKNKTADKSRGVSIAGLVISAISIPIIIITSIISFGALALIMSEDMVDYNKYYNNSTDYDDWYSEWYKDYYKNYYNSISYDDII